MDTYACARRLFALVRYLSSAPPEKKTTKQEIFLNVPGYDQEHSIAAERMLERDIRFLKSTGLDVQFSFIRGHQRGGQRRGYHLRHVTKWLARPIYNPHGGIAGKAHRPANNMLRLLDALRAYRWMSMTSLIEICDVKSNQVKIYIKLLRQKGIPIQSRRGRFGDGSNGGYRLRPGFDLPQWTPEQIQDMSLLHDPGEVIRRFLPQGEMI